MTDYFGDIVIPDTLASTNDLAAYLQTDAPTNAVALLEACTILVIDACEGAFYDTDPNTGIATDSTIQAAMKRAVVIQAAAWNALKIDPYTGGTVTVNAASSARKIGTASITPEATDAATASSARAAATTGLVPQAVKVLQQVNLLGTNPWYYG